MVIEKLRNLSYMVEFDTGQVMAHHIQHLKEDKTEDTPVSPEPKGEAAPTGTPLGEAQPAKETPAIPKPKEGAPTGMVQGKTQPATKPPKPGKETSTLATPKPGRKTALKSKALGRALSAKLKVGPGGTN